MGTFIIRCGVPFSRAIKSFSVLLLVLGFAGFCGTAQAVLTVSITSPANGTVVDPRAIVPFSVTASGAVAGISKITVAGERDPEGGWEFNYGYSPPTNSATVNGWYIIPHDATPGEELTLSAAVYGYADDPANHSITLIAAGAVPTPTPSPTPTPTPVPAGVVLLNGAPGGAVYDSARNLLYVTNADNGDVDVINPVSESITSSIATGGSTAAGLDISGDGNTLVVATNTDQTLVKINLQTSSVTSTIDTTTVNTENPINVAWIGSDTVFVGVQSSGSTFEPLLVLTPSTDGLAVTVTSSLQNLHEPVYVVASGDDSVAFVSEGDLSSAEIYAVDSNESIIAQSSIAAFTSNIAANQDGTRFLFNSTLLDAGLNSAGTLAVAGEAKFLRYGNLALVDGTTLYVLSETTGEVILTAALPVAASASAYVVAGENLSRDTGGTVFVIDPTSGTAMVVLATQTAAANPAWELYR